MILIRSLFIILFLCSIHVGCAQKKLYDPTKQPLSKNTLSEIINIGVVAPQLSTMNPNMYLYDNETLKSMGKGARHGAGEVLVESLQEDPFFILLLPVTMTAGAVIGAVAGAADPHKLPVTPTEDQLNTTQYVLKSVISSFDKKSKALQMMLVRDSNKLTSVKFIPINADSNIKGENIDAPIDASLYSVVEMITLAGHVGDNPNLSIKIKLRFFLRGNQQPITCLGWYEDEWDGEMYPLSKWIEDDGRNITDEIVNAYRNIYQKAIKYLFNKPSKQTHDKLNADSQVSTRCVMAKSQIILNHANWYCPQAELGIADSQRRIGDIFNYGGGNLANRDIIRAYIWYNLAAKGNNSVATNQLFELEKQLNPEQLREAQNRLEGFEPIQPGQCMKDLAEAGLIW